MKRYDYIDALRGIAIILVLIAHTSKYGINTIPVWFQLITAIDIGPRGVQLFYLVRAFTLCLSFSKRKKVERHPTRNFYIRRFFRIAPLFYTALIYYLWQYGYWSGNLRNYSLINIIATFTFFNGISPYWINDIIFVEWSIAVESTFYLLFPLLFRQLRSIRFVLLATLFTMILIQIIRLFLISLPGIQTNTTIQTYLFQFFPSQLPVFLIGMALFVLLTAHSFTNKNKKFLKLFFIAFMFLLFFQFIFKIKIIAGHYLYGLGFALLLFLLSRYHIKLFVNPITIYLGKVSFSIYLSHLAIFYWLNQLKLVDLYPSNGLINWSLRFLVLLLCSTAVSTLLFYTIEKRGQKLGSSIVDYLEKIPADNIDKELKTW